MLFNAELIHCSKRERYHISEDLDLWIRSLRYIPYNFAATGPDEEVVCGACHQRYYRYTYETKACY